jgi:hypothetical protein
MYGLKPVPTSPYLPARTFSSEFSALLETGAFTQALAPKNSCSCSNASLAPVPGSPGRRNPICAHLFFPTTSRSHRGHHDAGIACKKGLPQTQPYHCLTPPTRSSHSTFLRNCDALAFDSALLSLWLLETVTYLPIQRAYLSYRPALPPCYRG